MTEHSNRLIGSFWRWRSERSLPRTGFAVLVVVVVASGGAGYLAGLLVKSDTSGRWSSPKPTFGVSSRDNSIPALPAPKRIATMPSLRKSEHRAIPSSRGAGKIAAGSSSAVSSGAASSSQAASSEAQAPSTEGNTRTSTSTSTTPKGSSGSSGEIHHESGGGA